MNRFGVSFSHLEYMGFFVGLVIIVLAMIQTARVRREFLKFLGVEKLGRGKLGGSEVPVNRPLKTALYLLGTFCVLVALIGPQWGQKAHTVKAEGLDLCVAVDISRSMLAEDMMPSRLQYVKNQLSIALPRLGGDRASIVAFAGTAFQAAPLSNDHAALLSFLDPLDPSFVSDQATNLGAAVETCLGALGLNERNRESLFLDESARLIVLFTDGEDTTNDQNGALARAEKLGIPVYGFLAGTRQGGPMPLRDRGQLTGYIQDPKTGKPAVSKADPKGLQEIAEKTGGKVFDLSSGIDAWKDFEKSIADFKRDSKEAGTQLDREERFQIPLLIGWILLLLDFVLTETKLFRAGAKTLLLLLSLAGFSARDARAQDAKHVPPPKPAPISSTASAPNPWLVFKSGRARRAFEDGDLPLAESRYDEALAESSADFWARYNWAVSRLYGAFPRSEGEKPESTKLEAATKTFEKLLQEVDPKDPSSKELRRRLHFQLGQSHELAEKKPDALLNYYRAVDGVDAKDTLSQSARDNITRLLAKSESGQGGGGGGGGGESEAKDKPEEGKQNYTERGNSKPKYSGTDVSEDQAKQILESVSGEERQVQRRKAQEQAKEQQRQNQRDFRSTGKGPQRDKPW